MSTVINPACCPRVYFCVDGVIVSQVPGPAPTGFTGGPRATEAEAVAGCPLPPIQWLSLDCGGGNTLQYPDAIDVTFANVTGWIAPWIRNTVRVPIAPFCGAGAPTYNTFNPMLSGAPACGSFGGPTFTLRICIGCSGYPTGGNAYILFDGFLDGCTGSASMTYGSTFPIWPVSAGRALDFSTPVFHGHFAAPSPLGAYSFDVYLST